MEELNRKINLFWVEIRDLPRQPLRAMKFLQLKDQQIQQLIQNLRSAGEEGLVEYKKAAFQQVFHFLSNLIRSTPNHMELLKEKERQRTLMYLLILQASFHNGTNLPPQEKIVEEEIKLLPVAKIIQELQNEIAAEPSLKTNSEVKNLFIEFQLYKKEYENFAKLSPNISDERAPSFFLNFKERIDGLVHTINRNYHTIIQGGSPEPMNEQEGKVKQKRFLSSTLTQIQKSLSQELTKILATMDLALEEAFQFREPMVKLNERKDPIFQLLEEEKNIWDKEFGGVAKGAVSLGRIVADYLQEKVG